MRPKWLRAATGEIAGTGIATATGEIAGTGGIAGIGTAGIGTGVIVATGETGVQELMLPLNRPLLRRLPPKSRQPLHLRPAPSPRAGLNSVS